MSRLTISYDGSAEYDEWLEIRLTGPFSGIGRFYDRPQAFSVFAEQLSEYPIDPDRPPTFRHGDIVIRVVPIDSTGHLRFVVEISEFFEGDNCVSVALPATCAGVQEFQRALRKFIEDPTNPLEFEIR